MTLVLQIAAGIVLGGAGLFALFNVSVAIELAWIRWRLRRDEREWQATVDRGRRMRG